MNAEYPLAVLVSHRCVILRLMGASKTEPAPRHRLQQARDAGVEGQSETLRFAIGLLGLLLWATTMGREASDAVSTLALSCWSGVAGSVESVVSVIDLLVALLGGWVLIVGGLSLSATRWRASKTLAHRFRRISLREFARRESVAALVGAGGLTLAAIASVVYAGEAWASMLEADAQTLHLWGKEGLQKVLALFVLVLLFAGTAEMLWRRRWLVESTRISRAEARREWRRIPFEDSHYS